MNWKKILYYTVELSAGMNLYSGLVCFKYVAVSMN